MKRINFDLRFNEHTIKNMDDFRIHYNYEQLLEYYNTGKLSQWLERKGYSEYASKIRAITTTDSNKVIMSICNILEIDLDTSMFSKAMDYHNTHKNIGQTSPNIQKFPSEHNVTNIKNCDIQESIERLICIIDEAYSEKQCTLLVHRKIKTLTDTLLTELKTFSEPYDLLQKDNKNLKYTNQKLSDSLQFTKSENHKLQQSINKLNEDNKNLIKKISNLKKEIDSLRYKIEKGKAKKLIQELEDYLDAGPTETYFATAEYSGHGMFSYFIHLPKRGRLKYKLVVENDFIKEKDPICIIEYEQTAIVLCSPKSGQVINLTKLKTNQWINESDVFCCIK